MKKLIMDFVHRGLVACGFGPLVLAVLYWILQKAAVLEMLSANQVCIGILSLTALAFVSGGMNAIYQIEQIPLMVAVLIHGTVLYVGYLGTYFLNDWLERSMTAVFAFTAIFIMGYLVIWAIIYFITKKNTNRLNQYLKKSQRHADDA